MLRVSYEPAREAAADCDLRNVDHVLVRDEVNPEINYNVKEAGKERVGMYLVDDEVHVARRDHLPVEQVLLVANTADRPAGGLDGHHLLNHLFFVRVKEASEFRGVE